jgi:S1-C subfamily serine protease
MNSQRTGLGFTALLLLTCCLPTRGPAQATRNSQQRPTITTGDIAARVKRSLVIIITQDREGNPIAQGSGFFVTSHLVVTNVHVMKRASQAYAKSLADGVSYKVAAVHAFSLNHDLCVLYVPDSKGIPLSASPKEAVIGDDILVAGNPEGLEASFSKGIVSAVRKEAGLIQMDAPISPGSSGGPVVNRLGEVIGVSVSSLVEGQNLNFAVPIGFLEGATSTAPDDLSVASIGRLAVSDLENEGLRGPVKRVEERISSYSYNAASNTYTDGPPLLSSIEGFNQQGRLLEQEGYFNGTAVGGKSIWEYSEDGLIRRYAGLDAQGKPGQDMDFKGFSVHDAVDMYGGRIHFDETQLNGTKGARGYSEAKYDDMGNEIEWSNPGEGVRQVMKYNAQGWETECLEYRQGKLYSADRFTYEVTAHGNWVRKHDKQWLAAIPNLGYTPYQEYYREITYYAE